MYHGLLYGAISKNNRHLYSLLFFLAPFHLFLNISARSQRHGIRIVSFSFLTTPFLPSFFCIPFLPHPCSARLSWPSAASTVAKTACWTWTFVVVVVLQSTLHFHFHLRTCLWWISPSCFCFCFCLLYVCTCLSASFIDQYRHTLRMHFPCLPLKSLFFFFFSFSFSPLLPIDWFYLVSNQGVVSLACCSDAQAWSSPFLISENVWNWRSSICFSYEHYLKGCVFQKNSLRQIKALSLICLTL